VLRRHESVAMVGALWKTFRGSLALLDGRYTAAELERAIRRKYSEPVELEAARRYGAAGLSEGERGLLTRHVRSGDRVLDIGCAAGRVASALQAAGHDVVGVDISEAMIRAARTRLGSGAAVCVMGARALGFRDASFDAGLMLGSVIAYVHGRASRRSALGEARRVLRPGGRLLIVTPSRVGSWKFRAWFAALDAARRLRRRLGSPTPWEPGDRFGPAWSGDTSHLVYWHMYTPAELAADMRAAGLEVLECFPGGYMISAVARKPPR
jgi:SAM-dependent methyltransferase